MHGMNDDAMQYFWFNQLISYFLPPPQEQGGWAAGKGNLGEEKIAATLHDSKVARQGPRQCYANLKATYFWQFVQCHFPSINSTHILLFACASNAFNLKF